MPKKEGFESELGLILGRKRTLCSFFIIVIFFAKSIVVVVFTTVDFGPTHRRS